MTGRRLPLLPGWLRWTLVACGALAIAYFSVIRLPAGAGGPELVGPLSLTGYAHLVAYAGLATALAYALADSPRPVATVLTAVFLAAVGYGLAVELVQTAIPYRQFDPLDLLVNAVGAGLAVGAWRAVAVRIGFYRVGTTGDRTDVP